MKQRVRRDAEAGILEYYTDHTAVRIMEREHDEYCHKMYYESLQSEMDVRRRMALTGIDPDTGIRYSLAEFLELIEYEELTPSELHDVRTVIEEQYGISLMPIRSLNADYSDRDHAVALESLFFEDLV